LSTSASSLLSLSPSLRRQRLSSFDDSVHHSMATTKSMANLAPMPEKETFKAEEKKTEEIELAVWDKTRVWEWYNDLPWYV